MSDNDVTRTAMRIAISAWSKLNAEASESSMNDEFDVLKRYILLCPYVSPDSPAVKAALAGMENFNSSPLFIPNLIDERHDDDNENKNKNKKRDSEKEEMRPTTRERPLPHTTEKKPTTNRRTAGILFRSIILDVPLILLFATYVSLLWIHRLHDHYLVKQLETVVWTDDRAEEEITYYERECTTAIDMSTTDPNDLFLPRNVTPLEAYRHHLRHGFSVFPSALSQYTATKLRNYVRLRNQQLTNKESIFVVENANRYSFGLDTREPIVARAIQELANHPPLSGATQKILGPDPALIEMSVITSRYGAVNQHW
jgi:hypothetical protein